MIRLLKILLGRDKKSCPICGYRNKESELHIDAYSSHYDGKYGITEINKRCSKCGNIIRKELKRG